MYAFSDPASVRRSEPSMLMARTITGCISADGWVAQGFRKTVTEDYSLGCVRSFADTRCSLHIIGKKHFNHRAISFRSMDERVLDELAKHLGVLGYEFKRYVQSPRN